jgi:HK97 family phage prohead protease
MVLAQPIAQADLLDCMEVRFEAPADDGTIEGTAVRFNTLDSYRTTFDCNAFTWEGRSLPLLWAHDRAQVLGSVRSITPTGEGLRIKARLNLDVQRAREVHSMLTAGDINGLSIGFQRLKDESRAGGIRHITRAMLREVSIVALPSVPGSRVTSVRSTPDLSALHQSIRATVAALKGKHP